LDCIDPSLPFQRDGVIFEPEIDEEALQRKEEERTYFGAEDARLFEERMAALAVTEGEGDDDEEEDEDFANKAKKMINVTEDGKIKKKLLSAGIMSDGLPPVRGTVTIHYSFYFEGQDEPFDSSVLRGRPERFRLDDGRMIPGVEVAVKSMYNREKALFLIHSDYAFGPLGCPPRVPGNAPMLAKIELRDFSQEAEAEALLALEPEERNKKKTFADIEKVTFNYMSIMVHSCVRRWPGSRSSRGTSASSRRSTSWPAGGTRWARTSWKTLR